ncbi:acyl-CoA dehydrogenase family protein [Thermomonospora curvata]|uniref:Acyl-CoA dehydrogenase domain protein n=1 Tax=Thermomonospora curvata (strain ATCC 19995 / DSM 43183 / JCM 3096 / KCTC 9072 / NBRC 15933 / NCIMB 10081 / Henssen B9) TaxID=471852 RepID=D1A635_THECD|nr:acyl-CoA dehydrogenase family protein [Thermomonospora curvata]ACZ00134.1 acyl-CoA dehydrogenase domain protein [Thermomonospora curvata DSM 43183]
MRLGLTPEQQQFGTVAAELMAKPDADHWAALAELGATAVLVPESHGGLGGDETDLLAVLEEAGRAALADPLVEASVAARLLAGLGGELADEWLPKLASGEALVVFADGPYIPHGERADLILAERDGAICTAKAGQAQPSTDPARALTTAVEHVPVAEGEQARALLAEARDRGAALTAVYLLGVARRMIDMSVTYTKERTQFGRPIGSFQAVKHHLADALVAVDFARPPAYRAAYSLARSAPTASRDCSMAKAMASEAALLTARKALQVHGAIGYTLEYDLHRWMRRAWTLAAAWGDATHHQRRVAAALLDTEGEPARLP